MTSVIKKLLPFAVVMLVLSLFGTAQARPSTPSCPSGQTIQSTLDTGAIWTMCWEARDQEGIVLSDIRYQGPSQSQRRVLGEMSLSQIARNYDDGSASEYLVTSQGLGGNNFIPLSSNECANGQLRYASGKAVLCEVKKDAGFLYKYSTTAARTGKVLELMSASQLGSYSYTVQWIFHENGTIEPKVGLSGTVTKTSYDPNFSWPMQQDGLGGVGFVDNYFWRMDFDLGTSAWNDVAEQITSTLDVTRTIRTKNIETISNESARVFSPESKRFWRIRDGSETNGVSPISYELVLLNYDHQSKGANNEAWLQSDVYFTAYNACERFAVDNDTSNGCAWDISQFTNSQAINSNDIVVWNRLSYHHLPRDEDDNVIGMRWNGFKLLPRDWHAQNPL
jgi:primary-amine oxidase